MLGSCTFKFTKQMCPRIWDVSWLYLPSKSYVLLFFCISSFLTWVGTVGVPRPRGEGLRRALPRVASFGASLLPIAEIHFMVKANCSMPGKKWKTLALKQRHQKLLLKTFHSCTSISRACKRQEVVWKDARYWKSESQPWNIIVQTHKNHVFED